MNDIIAALENVNINFYTALARIVFSLIACSILGLERELHRQTAGWRTHVVIGVGATLLMLLSIWLPQTIGGDKGDPGRIAAQVVSGIGFLGAGAFLKVGNNMKGLTTAATIWFVAGLGLAIGAGMWKISFAVTIIILLVLSLFEVLERKLIPSQRIKLLQVWYHGKDVNRKMLFEILKEFHIGIQTVDATMAVEKKQTRLSVLVKVPMTVDLSELFERIRKTGKVGKIRLGEHL